jgi:hypothetical protein
MAMFGTRTRRTSRRALRKAHTKTLKAQAAAEKKFHAKASRKSDKLAGRAAKKASSGARTVRAEATTAAAEVGGLGTRAQKKARKAELKAKRKDATATARSYLGVVKVVAPVLAPFVYKAATAVRGQVDARRARSIGIGVEQLGEFSGHGAAMRARIAGLEPALAQMEPTHLAPADVEYRVTTTARLAELSAAVHAAERMPTPRRKAAHRSVAADLDRIDAELLQKLGVR